MPKSKSDENLFKNSTMTFGEHLEELRICLWKALVGLMIGFVMGLFVSPYVVKGIQSPLESALKEFYEEKSLKTVEDNLEEFKGRGYPDEILQRVEDDGLLPERVLINPAEFGEILNFTPADSPSETSNDFLVAVYLWRKIADDKRVRTSSLSAHEPFTIFIKAGLLVGVMLSSPWLFYQIWNFVAVGLYRHERKYIHIFLPFSLGLFFGGAALAFFFVFGPVLKFLFTFNEWLNIDPDPRISEWMGFVIMLPLGFGIAFQLPLVMLFMERIGLFSVATYLSQWRIAILVIFVISMFLTPMDPTSMLLMAVPLTVLYFGGVLLCHLLPRSESPYDDPSDEDEFV
jgi:sec-independent protein translocase protein TatC